MLNMVRALTLSLRRNGGRHRNAPVVLTVGVPSIDPAIPHSLPWLEPLGIEWRWLPEAEFASDSFWSNAAFRYQQSFRSDMVLMLDADVLVASPFDDMVAHAHRRAALAGLIAFSSPFENTGLSLSWPELFHQFDLPEPALPYMHTGFGLMNRNPNFAQCPAYFNQGVVCVPTDVASRLGGIIPGIMADLKVRTGSPFRLQLALALAIAKLDIPTLALPLRFNCANHAVLEDRFAGELRQARLLHLHGIGPVPKMELFADRQSMTDFTTRRDLTGVNAAARDILSDVLPLMHDPAGSGD